MWTWEEMINEKEIFMADFLENMASFAAEARPEHFQRIFGETLGMHVWGKFAARECNPFSLYLTLDSPNRIKLGQAIINWSK